MRAALDVPWPFRSQGTDPGGGGVPLHAPVSDGKHLAALSGNGRGLAELAAPQHSHPVGLRLGACAAVLAGLIPCPFRRLERDRPCGSGGGSGGAGALVHSGHSSASRPGGSGAMCRCHPGAGLEPVLRACTPSNQSLPGGDVGELQHRPRLHRGVDALLASRGDPTTAPVGAAGPDVPMAGRGTSSGAAPFPAADRPGMDGHGRPRRIHRHSRLGRTAPVSTPLESAHVDRAWGGTECRNAGLLELAVSGDRRGGIVRGDRFCGPPLPPPGAPVAHLPDSRDGYWHCPAHHSQSAGFRVPDRYPAGRPAGAGAALFGPQRLADPAGHPQHGSCAGR